MASELSVNLEQDLTEITNLIWGYMDKKYISQIKVELDGYRRDCEVHLCKEAQLLKAMIPFMPQESKLLQCIVDLIVYNDMIEQGFRKHSELQSLYRDDNQEREKVKKLMYKLILFKLIMTIEQVSEK